MVKTLNEQVQDLDYRIDNLRRLTRTKNKDERLTVERAIEDTQQKRIVKSNVLKKCIVVVDTNEMEKERVTNFMLDMVREISRREMEQTVTNHHLNFP